MAICLLDSAVRAMTRAAGGGGSPAGSAAGGLEGNSFD